MDQFFYCLIFTNNFIKAFPEKTILNLHPPTRSVSIMLLKYFKYYKEILL